MVAVLGVPFRGKGLPGDFEVMVRQEKYHDTILVFNDNVFDAQAEVPHDGAGTAVIRTASCKYTSPETHPRAIGIPTGWAVSSGGFKVNADGVVEAFAIRAITLAIERLVLTCISHPGIERIIYSSDPTDASCKRLGTGAGTGAGIFTLPAQILDFIEDRLHAVPSRVANRDTKFTLQRIDELEAQIYAVSALHRELALEKRGTKRPHEQQSMSAQDRERQALLVSRKKLDQAKMLEYNVVFVGTMTCGDKFVYEKIRPTTPPVLKQSTLGQFAKLK